MTRSASATARSLKRRILLYKIAGLSVLLSLIAEYGFGMFFMAFARAAVATVVIMSTIQPWRPPSVRTTLAWCVWAAHWLVILAVWLVAIAPRFRVDFLHVLFIGGFSLLILAVGTRVTLSHGGTVWRRNGPRGRCESAWALDLSPCWLESARLFPAITYFEHLAWAGLLWIAGMLFWGFYLVRLIRTHPAPQS